MCTVTYIPANGGALITSNRDEKRGRPPAMAPEFYTGRTGRLLFPKDARAGGTWFVLHEKGTALVLLNGARERHIPQPPYRSSRGLVLLELADSDNSIRTFKQLNLSEIEPFSVILVEENILNECSWDGIKKVHHPVDAAIPHIWSSVTLYDAEIRRQRLEWFEEWLQGHPLPDQENVLQFHRFAGNGDPQHSVLMNRGDSVLTVSITSLQITDGHARMFYQDNLSGSDVFTGSTSVRQLPLTKRTPAPL